MTITPEVPEDMTELYDADIPRVDLVGAAANGTRFLLAKSATGLVPADMVRELVKAGRALSAANETKLRAAAESIQTVLDSLPKPQPEPLTKENPAMADENTAPAEAEATIEKEADEQAQPETDLADATVAKSADEALAEVVKADGLIAVYDACGALVGVVKPNAITPVEGPGTTDPDADGDSVQDTDGDGDGIIPEAPEPEPAPVEEAAADLTSADGSSQIDGGPADDAPSEDEDEDSRVIPGTHTVQSPVTKTATAAETDIAALLKEALEPLTEKLAKTAELAETVEVLQEQVRKFGAQPDNRALPAFNGATGANAGLAPRAIEPSDALEPLKKALAAAEETGDAQAIEKAAAELRFESIKARFS